MRDKLIELTDAYLTTPSTDYALLVNGAWGSGKTYFWKNVLVPRIESFSVVDGKGKYRCVYVSLYGITSAEEIRKEVFLALHPILSSKWAKVAGGVARVALRATKIDLDALKLNPSDWAKLENVVLCFDDLERCPVSVSDVLGNINQYVEHGGAKTFILCNEDGIREDDQPEYRRIKEKVVGRSVAFVPDLEAVFAKLVEAFGSSKELRRFLRERQELVLDLFKRSEAKSLRILKQAVYSLCKVFDAIDPKAEFAANARADSVFIVLPLSFEMGKGRATDQQLRRIAGSSVPFYGSSLLKPDTEKKDFYTTYSERYFDGEAWGLLVSPAIAEYVVGGVLDSKALDTDLRAAYAKKSPLDTAVAAILGNYLLLSDEDFRKHWEIVSEALHAGSFSSMAMLLRTYVYAMYWSQLGVIALTKSEVTALHHQAVDKAIASGHIQYDDDLDGHLSMTMTDADADARAFESYLSAKNDELQKANNVRLGEAFLDALATKPDDTIKDFVGDLFDVPVLDLVPVNAFAGVLKHLPNASKALFGQAVERRYLKIQPSSVTRREHTGLGSAAMAIREVATQDTTAPAPISNVILLQIADKMEEAAKRVAPIVPAAAATLADTKPDVGNATNGPSKVQKL